MVLSSFEEIQVLNYEKITSGINPWGFFLRFELIVK
ncbi:MAG: hypothetical protein ACJATA_000771 [Sphingobacteriales bacterium]|jgi:hypothetical protein